MTRKMREEIDKDLNRTKTSQYLETEKGISELRRLLQAVAFVLPNIGYCQGMNFIAGVLLDLAESEEKAFLIFMHILLV